MTPEQATDAVQRARDALAEYATLRRDIRNRVLIAHALGVTKTDIAELTGLARTTVDRFIDRGKRDG